MSPQHRDVVSGSANPLDEGMKKANREVAEQTVR
jgi:hypothetical protein